VNLKKELALYHRDDTGKVVKKNDHLMDCMRYLVRAIPYLQYGKTKEAHYATTQSGISYVTSRPPKRYKEYGLKNSRGDFYDG
jgi:hypothetical protein